MPIYTRKGDKGETGLLSKDPEKKIRVDKDSLRIEAIGALDELNSYLGIVTSTATDKNLVKCVTQIQVNLFTINAILAGADLKFNASKITALEKRIDIITEQLNPLTNFLLPGGSVTATHLMYARALSRKAERRVVSLSKAEKVHPNILKYVNRLSDMLFTLFREANHLSGEQEVLWRAAPQKSGRTQK